MGLAGFEPTTKRAKRLFQIVLSQKVRISNDILQSFFHHFAFHQNKSQNHWSNILKSSIKFAANLVFLINEIKFSIATDKRNEFG